MTGTAIVVGAGVFGLSTARELGTRGWRVTVIDAHGPGVWGPSTADTRILRCAHGPEHWYAEMAWRARGMWQALEKETDRRLFEPTGVLTLTPTDPGDDGWASATRDCLDRLGILVEPVGPRDLTDRFPDFATTSGEGALFEPDAGILRAREAVLALADSATAAGVRLQQAVATPFGDQLLVDGSPMRADVVIWAVGTALPELFPGITSVRPVRMDSWYFASRGPWRRSGSQPAWLDRTHGCYGIPDLGSGRVKIIVDSEVAVGTGIDTPPDDLPRTARRYAATRLPALADARLLRREPCWYATTPDEHFLLAPNPSHPNVWLLGGDSGHGFKHGPAWGTYVCNVIEGKLPAEPHLSLR